MLFFFLFVFFLLNTATMWPVTFLDWISTPEMQTDRTMYPMQSQIKIRICKLRLVHRAGCEVKDKDYTSTHTLLPMHYPTKHTLAIHLVMFADHTTSCHNRQMKKHWMGKLYPSAKRIHDYRGRADTETIQDNFSWVQESSSAFLSEILKPLH